MRFPSFARTFDIPDGSGAGGAGAPAPSAPSTPATPAQTGAPGAGGGGAAAGAPTTPTGFSYAEDRSQWIPPHRLNEVSTRYRTLAEQNRDLERRYRALAGLEQPRNQQHDAVRQQFGEVFPELAPLLQSPDALGQILELVKSGRLAEMQGTVEAYWGRHAQTTARELVNQFAKSAGVDVASLSPRAHNRMALHLKAFIEEDPSGQRQSRFEMADPSLIEEALADMNGLFIDPVRRSTAAAAARTVEGNRRLPEAGVRGSVPPNAEKPAQTRSEKREAARQYVLANRG
jgi:hypothetical protein